MNKLLPLVLLLVSFGSESFAKAYFDDKTIPAILLDVPASEGSKHLNDEIATILKLQKNADPKEVAEAEKERDLRHETVAQFVEPSLIRENFPKLYHLLDRTADTSKSTTDSIKNYWGTRRPYLVDKRIKALIESYSNVAYPSGHTTGSYVYANVLSLLIPSFRDKFLARAEAIAQRRVLVGMHFPQDLAGGRKLSLLIVGALLENPEFKKKFRSGSRRDETVRKIV